MPLTPVLAREEYVEQAYFFRVFAERLREGQPAQNILPSLRQELLSTTLLPLAIQFMIEEVKHAGRMADGLVRLAHYFTPFQAFVLGRAEDEESRLTFDVALSLLEREAEYKAKGPTQQGLFLYQIETISRHRLGYAPGLEAMRSDAFFDDDWRDYMKLVRHQLGGRELSELILARSEQFVLLRRRVNPEYQPTFTVLFGEKEGKIAAAHLGKDSLFLFSTLQRQLGYPSVPLPPKPDPRESLLEELSQKLKNLESRLGLIEVEVRGETDLSQFLAKPPTTDDERA